MNDQQIDAAVRECVERIESGDYNTNAVIRILVRRVRDAEQEMCAKIGDNRAALDEQILVVLDNAHYIIDHCSQSETPASRAWFDRCKEIRAAIRAPRTEVQHGQG